MKMQSPATFFIANLKLFAIALLLLVITSACATTAPNISKEQKMKDLFGQTELEIKETVHPNGLTLRLPEKLEIKQIPNGFLIEPPSVRGLSYASVNLLSQQQSPAGDWSRQRQIGSRTIHYRIEETEGSTGGKEYKLQAWELYPKGIVIYQQSEQSKSAAPEHDFAWYIVENTSFK